MEKDCNLVGFREVSKNPEPPRSPAEPGSLAMINHTFCNKKGINLMLANPIISGA
jgi:hypothetical protein